MNTMQSLEDSEVVDAVVWHYLDLLSGADLQVEPGVYLHSRHDYRSWLTDLSRQA